MSRPSRARTGRRRPGASNSQKCAAPCVQRLPSGPPFPFRVRRIGCVLRRAVDGLLRDGRAGDRGAYRSGRRRSGSRTARPSRPSGPYGTGAAVTGDHSRAGRHRHCAGHPDRSAARRADADRADGGHAGTSGAPAERRSRRSSGTRRSAATPRRSRLSVRARELERRAVRQSRDDLVRGQGHDPPDVLLEVLASRLRRRH
jgi:hypothetical protein